MADRRHPDCHRRPEGRAREAAAPEVAVTRRRYWFRALLLGAAIAFLAAVPPSLIERLPSVCLNRHLFGWCPGCGSLRALVHFFHGSVGPALKYNVNCLLTGPALVFLLLANLGRRERPSPS